MFVYEPSGCGFESSCSHLNFRFRACFEQGVPWHSGNYRVWIHSETGMWHDKNIQLYLPTNVYTLWHSKRRWKYYTIESRNEHSQKKKIKMWNFYWSLQECLQKCSHVIEKLPGNGYENRIKDNFMLVHRLQRGDY